MRGNENVDEQFIEEYKRTEVLRQSMKDVKQRAKEEQDKRKNIRQVKSNATSKIAQNMKAVSKGKKVQAKEACMPQWQQGVRTGNLKLSKNGWDTTERTNQINQHKALCDQLGQELEEMKQNYSRPTTAMEQACEPAQANIIEDNYVSASSKKRNPQKK